MIFANDRSVLVIFCKRPTLGVGKQRVAASLGSHRALELAELLLDAALEDAAAWQGDVVIAPANPADQQWAAELLPAAHVIPQLGTNLGERINHVDQLIRNAGAKRVLYIGTDAPGLTSAVLRQAEGELDNHDVVFIPAEDGGVTVMGARQAWPDLGQLPWETDKLGAALDRACSGKGLTCSQLDPGYDIDTWGDLRAAQGSLAGDTRPSRANLCQWATQQENISIIVPVMRDAAALRELLTTLTPMRTEVCEVLIVDGDRNKEIENLCAHFAARYVASAPCRGKQMAAGAELATGNIFWFIHADCEPLAAAPELIRAHINCGQIGGYFRFRFRGKRNWQKALLEACTNWRAKMGTPYSDQALFMTRDAYERVGGFPELPLFEEVELVRKLRAMGSFTAVDAAVNVSPRRWERDGWATRTLHNRLLAVGYALGIHPAKLALHYQRRNAI